MHCCTHGILPCAGSLHMHTVACSAIPEHVTRTRFARGYVNLCSCPDRGELHGFHRSFTMLDPCVLLASSAGSTSGACHCCRYANRGVRTRSCAAARRIRRDARRVRLLSLRPPQRIGFIGDRRAAIVCNAAARCGKCTRAQVEHHVCDSSSSSSSGVARGRGLQHGCIYMPLPPKTGGQARRRTMY